MLGEVHVRGEVGIAHFGKQITAIGNEEPTVMGGRCKDRGGSYVVAERPYLPTVLAMPSRQHVTTPLEFQAYTSQATKS